MWFVLGVIVGILLTLITMAVSNRILHTISEERQIDRRELFEHNNRNTI